MKRFSLFATALVASLSGMSQISDFGIDLYKQTASQGQNMVISPFSISPTLSMVGLGAKGETQQQMSKTLHSNLGSKQHYKQMGELLQHMQEHKQVEICITNRLWLEQTYKVLRRYRRKLDRYFDAEVQLLNFKQQPEMGRSTINTTIKDDTKGYITELLPHGSITPTTSLVLTNAIYFKGKWAKEIKPDQTKRRDFKLGDGNIIQCPTMYVESEFPMYMGDGFKALQMDYQGNGLSLLIILPDENIAIGDFEQRFSNTLYQNTLDGLEVDDKVKVYLPKFKINTGLSLKPTLSKMGMPIAFGGGADFSGMSGAKDLCIGNVYHKAYIEVSEEGTVAAAATAATMVRKSAMSRDKVFRADRPFIFVLKDNQSGTMLFVGKVERPS